MKILLTGATGYLGSHLAQRLTAKKYTLGCVVRHQEHLGRLEPLREQVWLLPVDQLEDGIASFHPEIIIHTACTYARGNNTERDVLEGNLFFPLRVMQAAKNVGISRWINTDTLLPPMLNSYAFAKNQFSQWGAYYAGKGEFTFVNLVLEHFYGPDAPEDQFLPWVMKKLACDAPLELTAGTQRRDFVYIEDVQDIYEAALYCPVEDTYTEIEVGTGETPTIREVVEYLKTIMWSKSELHFGSMPMRDGEPNSRCNPERMRYLRGCDATNWKSGLRLVAERYMSGLTQ